MRVEIPHKRDSSSRKVFKFQKREGMAPKSTDRED